MMRNLLLLYYCQNCLDFLCFVFLELTPRQLLREKRGHGQGLWGSSIARSTVNFDASGDAALCLENHDMMHDVLMFIDGRVDTPQFFSHTLELTLYI